MSKTNTDATGPDDLTLNQKINKVIAEIKKINQDKAQKFGCIQQKRVNEVDDERSRELDENDKSERLLEFIQKEKKREQNKKYYQTQREVKSTAVPCDYQNESSQNIKEEELSSLFDLTSAKRPVNKYYETYKQQLKNSNHLEQPQQFQSSRQRYQKYENILAGPGSIYVENGQTKQKSIVEEKFQGSSRLLNQQYNPYQIIQEEQQTSQQDVDEEEIEKWKLINQRTEDLLQNEINKNKQLEYEVTKYNQERQLVEEILEEQELQQQLKEQEIKRISQKTAKLTKNLIREQCIKENLAQNNGYSNPAKLMNYIKMKKSIANSQFDNVKQYMTHMEAFTKLSGKQTMEERQRQKQLLHQITLKRNNSTCGQKQQSSDNFCRLDEQIGIKQRLEAQRKALRDFSNFYLLNNYKNNSKNAAFKSEMQPAKDTKQAQPPSVDQIAEEKPMTLLGMDYFRVVYVSCGFLILMLIVVFFAVEEDKIKRVTMVQGALSIFLIAAMAWYHNKIDKKKKERVKRQKTK